MTHFKRPKMKALSLMLWLVSSEYWLTFENRLWRTRVDGPDGDKHTNTSPISIYLFSNALLHMFAIIVRIILSAIFKNTSPFLFRKCFKCDVM